MTKKIDLEYNLDFKIVDALGSIEMFYKGYKILVEEDKESAIHFNIRSSDDGWVAGNIKTLNKCKSIINLVSAKQKGFKPFNAYYESGEKIFEIKVNSISKDGRQCNATRVTEDKFSYKGERITLGPRSTIYEKSPHNEIIISSIRQKQTSISKIESEILFLTRTLKKDTSLSGYLSIDSELDI